MMGRHGSRKGWTRIVGAGLIKGRDAAREGEHTPLTRHGPAFEAGWNGLGRDGDGRLVPILPDSQCSRPAGEGGLVEILRAAIAGLPLFEREVYLLAAREGLDDRAIGQRLGIGDREVRCHLAAALVQIAGALDGEIAD
jgi:hypothetical protein